MPKTKIIEEFPLSPKDILSSFDVIGMSSQEFGIYCKLLFASWIQKQQCFLPFDEHNICELCNITAAEWEQSKPRVIKKFKFRDDFTGRYIYNEVLLSKYNSMLKEEKNVKGKQLSAAAELLNYPFEDFWDDYDKKVGSRDRILPKWMKLSDKDREEIRADIPKRKAAQPDKKFRPKPERYIGEKMWRDEIIDYSNNKNGQGTSTQKPGGYNADGLSNLNNAITNMPKQ